MTTPLPSFLMNAPTNGHTHGNGHAKLSASPETMRADSFAHLAKLTANVPGLVYQFRLTADGKASFPFVNQWVKENLNLEPAALSVDAGPFFAAVHPEDIADLQNAVAQSAQSLTQFILGWRFIAPDGRIIFVEGRSTPERLPDGSTQWSGLLQDVTARKQAELKNWAVAHDLSQSKSRGYLYADGTLSPVEHAKLSTQAVEEPLKVQGVTIGTLGVQTNEPLSADEQTLLETIALQVAQALERARLAEQTQENLLKQERLSTQLETVAQVSAAASTLLERDHLLQEVSNLTKSRFGLYHAHVYLFDEVSETLQLVAGAGEVGKQMVEEKRLIPVALETSIVARAARTRQVVVINDTRQSATFLSHRLLPNTRSELAVPLLAGERVLGVFDVQSDQPDRFGEEDIRIQTTLAAQIAIALQNANLFAEQTATLNRLQEIDQLKSSFLANMSHELRTPLNSILGFTDVILEGLDGPITAPMENDLKVVQKNGQHLLGLINDILDMAKIEAGRMTINPEKFDLREMVDEVMEITGSLAQARKLSLMHTLAPDVELMVDADHVRVRQVLINLVGNSIKFTEQGGVTISAERRGDNMLICVADTGIGIPADRLENVFEAFSQVDNSTTRKAGGTGLGLPISRRLIELHGGRLWAESTGLPGDGARFFVELPIEFNRNLLPEIETI